MVEEFAETRADRLVSTNIAQTMRSRDVTVTGENFKPNTRYYTFFDGIDISEHMTPTSATYGGLCLGRPLLPSILSIIADSSPHM